MDGMGWMDGIYLRQLGTLKHLAVLKTKHLGQTISHHSFLNTSLRLKDTLQILAKYELKPQIITFPVKSREILYEFLCIICVLSVKFTRFVKHYFLKLTNCEMATLSK